MNQKIPEQSDLTDHEEALQSFKLLDSETAHQVLKDFWSPTLTQEEFVAKIEEFNALPAEERNLGRIETKTLENRRVREAALTHSRGFPYVVRQNVDGSLTLYTTLSEN